MKTYRVAILGCRGRGTAAARAYNQHPRTEVVGLCDLIPGLLKTLGDELDVAARYDDLDRMIAAEAPDIVAIPTGTEFHYDLALRVLEYGVHIDIEKPICTSLVEADEVLAKATAHNVQVAVHHQGRSGGGQDIASREPGSFGHGLHLGWSGIAFRLPPAVPHDQPTFL